MHPYDLLADEKHGNHSLDALREEGKISTKKNPFATSSGGPQNADQCRADHASIKDNESSNGSTPPASVASLPPNPGTPAPSAPAAAPRRRGLSLSLNPGALRAVLKSATQGNPAAVLSRKPSDKPGQAPSARGEAGSSGSAPARNALSSAATVTASQHPSQPARGGGESARRGIGVGTSLGSRFMRASSMRSRQTGAGGPAVASQEVSAEESSNELSHNNESAGSLERGRSGSQAPGASGAASSGAAVAVPPPQPPQAQKPARRRVSMSFSPSYLRKAVGLTPSQDDQRGITNRSEDSRHVGGGPLTDTPGPPAPPFRVHPHPPGARAAMRTSSIGLSPAAVRAAMRSAMARDISGGSSERKKENHEGTIDMTTQKGPGDEPVAPTKWATVVGPKPTVTPPPLLVYQQPAQQRQRRSLRRSASFTAGTLRSVTTMGESRGEDRVGARVRDAETSRVLAAGVVAGTRALDDFSGDLLSGDDGGGRSSGRRSRLRGRSMSLAVMGRGSNAFGALSAPPSPSSMRGDGSGNSRSGSGRSPGLASGGVDAGGGGGGGGGGLRQRLRQKAAGVGVGGGAGTGFHRRGRTRSASPPNGIGQFLGGHARTISVSSDLLSLDSSGSWAGPGWRSFGVVDGGGEERHRGGGLPSILDAVPAWKRPALLKGLQQRCDPQRQ